LRRHLLQDADTKKMTYTFIDSYHNLCLDKKDTVLDEIEPSERLLKHISDKDEYKNRQYSYPASISWYLFINFFVVFY
jgi:hypothetical protein